MKRKNKTRIMCALLMGLVAFSGCGKQKEEVASVVGSSGPVTVLIQPSASFADVKTGEKLCSGDSIKTGENGKTQLELINDKSQISLGENSFLEIKNFSEKELKQISGTAIYKISPQNKELKIQTQHGVATVLGTILRIDADDKGTSVSVEKGKVGFKKTGSNESVLIEAGMIFSSTFTENKAQSLDPIEKEQLFNPDASTKPIINPR